MRLLTTIFLVCLVSLSLSSCVTLPNSTTGSSTLPASFTTKNIMKVHQGMSSKEILKLFGEPKNIRASICGMSPNKWRCTTWEYGKFPYGHAKFTFSGKHNALILNDFKVDRD